jgi:hypothetical protein
MIAIAGQGYEGIALSFVNDTQELPYFCDRKSEPCHQPR